MGTVNPPTNKKDTPLYNSRLIKNYVEYAKIFLPHVDIDSVLQHAEMTRYEVEDSAHWFQQHQVDRFNEALVTRGGNPNISREVGRYSATSKASGAIRKYALGFMSSAAVYRVLEKITSKLSRASTFRTKKLGTYKVEVSVNQNPGVEEKPYQCANRIGILEAVSKLFTKRFSNIEHPSCIHKGVVR